jgi:hypothetical protein
VYGAKARQAWCDSYRVEADEEWAPADDVVDELSIAGARIEDGVRGVDTMLDEVSTEGLPDVALSGFVLRTEPPA